MKYQVTETDKDGIGKTFHYFESAGSEEEVTTQAENIIKERHQKKRERKEWDIFTNADPSRPTIIIKQYPIPKGGKGIVYKTKWR